jgi:hypothetical protein
MAISNKLRSMTWGDFKGAHPGVAGGRGTQALAAKFRQAKGLPLTPELSAALRRQSVGRTMALRNSGDTAYLADPGKPLPGVNHDMLGPPDAPRVGGRTQPGTTPRQLGPGNGGMMTNHPWVPKGLGANIIQRLRASRGGAGDNEVYKRRGAQRG